MTHEHPSFMTGLISSRGTSAALCALALGLAPAAGCSEEFKECYDAWQECKTFCPPSVEDEQEIEAAAREGLSDCLDGCQPLPADPACHKSCLEEYAELTELVGCNDACDAEFEECLEENTPSAPLPSRLAQPAGSGLYDVDRSALQGLLSSPMLALHGAGIAPLSLEGGTGFVLVSAEPSAVLRQLGARPGDVLVRLAGQPPSAASLRAGLHALLSTGQAHATLLREGAPLQLTYRLR